jgi:N-acetylmuramic acid 6-phosphate etherase
MAEPNNSQGKSTKAKLEEFLKVAPQFRLGELPTEKSHPLTQNLSALCHENPIEALALFHRLDCQALNVVKSNLVPLHRLAQRVGEVLHSGGSIYLTGCGSTGRLSLACESLWRKEKSGTAWEDRVIAFMAGGDIAMVRSVESFEDHPEYGVRQLEESGFQEGDLLIATTEGGETPFVIGATERASEISSRAPFFLYCNPDTILASVASRSAQVLGNAQIEKICLSTGPMALSGSTRLQASTALMAAVGGALLTYENPSRFSDWIEQLYAFWKGLDTSPLSDFVKNEASHYKAGGRIKYVSDPDLAITVLTDTTERAPTFSMFPFANDKEAATPLSACSLSIPLANNRKSAWRMLLGRDPCGLEWQALGGIATSDRLLGFDFSNAAVEIHSAQGSNERDNQKNVNLDFNLTRTALGLKLQLGEECWNIPTGSIPPISIHLILKMLLNAHSTLVMGRLGRFNGNLMTWVKPSNYKLVDRAIRYTDQMLTAKGINRSYAEIAEACFELMQANNTDQPLVLAMVAKLSGP